MDCRLHSMIPDFGNQLALFSVDKNKKQLVETAWETRGLNRVLAAVALRKMTWYSSPHRGLPTGAH